MRREAELGPYLKFRERYLEKVLTGVKRVTIRHGVVRPRFSFMYIVCCEHIYAEAVITKVYYTKLGRVGEEVIKAEGLESREVLLQELREIYGDVDEEDPVTVIYFTVVRRYERPVPVKKIN
ncbi:MAG: ASCH domain-containing protein [Pyrobaculum sp.]